MKLYEINAEIESLLDALEPDPETGEIKLFPAQATYIWEPGQVIQQTFIGLDGQPLEKESGAAQRRFSQKK